MPCIVFIDFIKVLVQTLFEVPEHIPNSCFEALALCLSKAYFSGPTVIKLLDSGGSILSWLFLSVVYAMWSNDV